MTLPDRLARPEQGASATRRLVGEAALVTAAGLVQIGGTLLASTRSDHGELTVGGVLLVVIGVAALPFRHRHPVATLWTIFAATLTYSSLDYPPAPIFVALIIALVHVVLTGHRRAAVAVLVAGYVGFNWLGALLGRADAPTLAATTGVGSVADHPAQRQRARAQPPRPRPRGRPLQGRGAATAGRR